MRAYMMSRRDGFNRMFFRTTLKRILCGIKRELNCASSRQMRECGKTSEEDMEGSASYSYDNAVGHAPWRLEDVTNE